MENALNTLKHGNVEIGVLSKGAELSSYKVDGKEFMWDRQPEFWAASSPVLFPFVGVIKDGKYVFEGKDYEITTRHGFARNNDFDLVEKGENFLKFKFSSNEETLEKYPFEFDFFLIYTIIDNSLEIKYEVLNKTKGDMYFSLGAHPAFALELNDEIKLEDYYLEFEKDETAQIYQLRSDALILEEKKDYLQNEKIIKLSGTIFDNDAIIFENLNSAKVTLKCSKSTRELSMDYSKFPFVAFWSKPKAPFVCIEPWFGISDFANCTGKLEEKKGILKLKGNDVFTAKIIINGKL